MTGHLAEARPVQTESRRGALPLLGVGGVCGLAWAASIRGFMTQIAGDESGVSWPGTFGWILLPGVVIGLLLAWAEYLRRPAVGAAGAGWPLLPSRSRACWRQGCWIRRRCSLAV